MTKGLKFLDGVALTLTGVGLIGGALAAIDVLPAPMGVVCAIAIGVGVLVCIVVRMFSPAVREHVESWFDDEYRKNVPHDTLRLKNAATDPTDPSVPGTLNWQATQDAVAKPF